MGTWKEQNARRNERGQFAEFTRAEAVGTLEDDTPASSYPSRDELKTVIARRATQLSQMGYVPAQGLNTPLGDPRYAGGTEQVDTWWGAEKTLAEYGRPAGDYRQMPDNYTPNMTSGRGTDSRRHTHRMHYEGAGVSMRMPSATSIRRFENENPGTSIVVPVTAKTPKGDVTGWVRLTKSRGGNNWEARAGGFGNDAAGAERAADMAEAVQCVMESRRVTSALRSAGNLPERRRQRLAREGGVIHRVNTSKFITGIGYDPSAGAVAVEIRGKTYGYSATPEQMERFLDNAKEKGFGHAYNVFVKGPLPRAEISTCSKCQSTYASHLAHRCRIAPVPGGASGRYEGRARRSAAAFAARARSASASASRGIS